MDGLHLPLALTGAYHEIVGKAAYLPGIQQSNIDSVLVTGYFYYLTCYFQRFQKSALHDEQFLQVLL